MQYIIFSKTLVSLEYMHIDGRYGKQSKGLNPQLDLCSLIPCSHNENTLGFLQAQGM